MRQGAKLRSAMLDAVDEVHIETDGETPDHLIVSEEVWNLLEEKRRFEELEDNSNPKRPGYLGMKVWYSRTLDERGKVALLLSDQAFNVMVPKAKDFSRGSPYNST